jgi:starch phosphorylase
MAELMIPAAEVSEQISLASTEASGTGNMKFMMNGAITLGTEDGANVEIHEAVGDDNIVIFGMHTPEVMALRKRGYSPAPYIANNAQLKACLDFIGNGIDGHSFENLYRTFTNVDFYMAAADFADYCAAHDKVDALYADRTKWNTMSLNNIAASGIFAADRSIADYSRDIWGLTSLK